MNLFLEKCQDAFNRSASFLKKESFWGLEFSLYEKYKNFLAGGPRRTPEDFMADFLTLGAIPLIEFVIIPAALAIIPLTINLVFNVTASALNLILSPIIVPVLTVIHVLKSVLRANIVDVISKMESPTFDKAINKLKSYEPKSRVSADFKAAMLNTLPNESNQVPIDQVKSKKADAIYFFKHPSHNAGRDVAKCFLDAAAEKAKVDEQFKQDEKVKTELEAIRASLG